MSIGPLTKGLGMNRGFIRKIVKTLNTMNGTIDKDMKNSTQYFNLIYSQMIYSIY